VERVDNKAGAGTGPRPAQVTGGGRKNGPTAALNIREHWWCSRFSCSRSSSAASRSTVSPPDRRKGDIRLDRSGVSNNISVLKPPV